MSKFSTPSSTPSSAPQLSPGAKVARWTRNALVAGAVTACSNNADPYDQSIIEGAALGDKDDTNFDCTNVLSNSRLTITVLSQDTANGTKDTVVTGQHIPCDYDLTLDPLSSTLRDEFSTVDFGSATHAFINPILQEDSDPRCAELPAPRPFDYQGTAYATKSYSLTVDGKTIELKTERLDGQANNDEVNIADGLTVIPGVRVDIKFDSDKVKYCEENGGDSEGDSEGGGCKEHSDCYENGDGLCNKGTGECFIPEMCYAASAVKGATQEIRETPSDELVVGKDFKEKDLNEPNSPDGMNFGVYGGYLNEDGTHCMQLPDGLGAENVVEIREAMLDPNNQGEALCWTSDANDAFLQCDDAALAAMSDADVKDAQENLKVKGKMAITNPLLSAVPGVVNTFAVNYDVEQ